MKILVYTVTDFKHYADNCIEMLFENIKKKDNVDFCVISSIPPPEKFKYKTIVDNNGLNAGTFCFKNLNFLSLVRSLYEPFISGEPHADARLEQSSYNYAVCKYVAFDFSLCFNLSSVVKLFASDCWFTPEKKLYHFCGFSNEMFSKFIKMSNFLNEKQRRHNKPA
jgi:hypothetical protein